MRTAGLRIVRVANFVTFSSGINTRPLSFSSGRALKIVS